MNTTRLTLLLAAAVLTIISLGLAGCRGAGPTGTYDILIKNGLVYDGSLAEPVVEDIAVKDGKIAAIGKGLTGGAARTIEAEGRIVTPGFIDSHSHSDIPILMSFVTGRKPDDLSFITPAWKQNHNYLTQGVTTIVTGNCGGGFWETREWLDLIASIEFGSNVYHLVPYGMLRQQLFGDNQPTVLTEEQLGSLKKMVEKGMQEGALGVSVGLEYAPDCFGSTDELVEIARVVARYGGLIDAHTRDQTGTMHENGLPGVLNSINEMVEIGKRARIPVHISHIQLDLPWNDVRAEQMHCLIEQARAEGVDITADQHPYEAGFSFL
ncbi:MAG: hypothetical protein RDV41_04150, partial [Planctomycetota bacterium]|nr:hypothetical protein [Planctomycetota bacterium]